jgi:signal transduction histidine kinase
MVVGQPPARTASHGNLAGAEQLFALAFQSLPAAVVVFDRRLSAVFKNPAASALLPDDSSLTAGLSRLTLEGQCEDWPTELRKILETQRPRQIDAVAAGGAAQGETCYRIAIHPLRDPAAGESAGGLLLIEDVTGRMGMQRQLAVAERLAAVGRLAARVAHELNNPLDGVLRYTNLALRRLIGTDDGPPTAEGAADAKTVEYLEHARSGILRMRDIISALLEFSRAAPSGFEQATINRIVEDAVTALEGKALEAGVAVVCSFHQADMPVVRGSSIFQVCCNLIKNAIDAMESGGTLTVTTAIAGPDVVLTFEDTGIGLPEEAERIFEPFFTTKPPGKGTGLGLAVCRDLIEKYGGTITAHRRQPRGTTFVVRIPTRNCAAHPPERAEAAPDPGDAPRA